MTNDPRQQERAEGTGRGQRGPGRGCSYTARRLLLALLVVVGVAVLAAATVQGVTAAADRRHHAPPGQLVDVGGHRLHIYCLGEGSPTVILEGGAGEVSPLWGWVQPQVAATTRVCAYDRAGFGWSEAGPRPRDGQVIVEELHRLLAGAGVEPPYVLAGHSLGGELVRLYASHYPAEVAGLVLVDSSHPDQNERIPTLRDESAVGRQYNQAATWAAFLGLMRLFWHPAGPNPELPELQRDQMRAFFSTAHPYRAYLAEDEARAATSAQVRTTGSLGGLPLVVVTTDGGGTWSDLQRDMAALSTNSRLRRVAGGDHMGLLTDPLQAQATGQAVLDVVQAARSGEPLE